MKKRLLACVMIVAMVIGLTACGDSETEVPVATETTGEKILSVQIGPDPETIDPALCSTIDGANMILHSYECLLTVDKDGLLAPGQAETWEKSADGLTWTFHLRDGLKWSDGTPLTANDFVYSWKRVCDPAIAAPYAETVLGMVDGYAEAIKGNTDALNVVAKDDQTLVVTLANQCSYFGSLAAFTTLSPVQQAAVEANSDAGTLDLKAYVSNGSFYVTEWVPGSHIMMSKNPNYWNADAVKLDKIKFNLMEDANEAYSAFQTGEVSMIKEIPAEEIYNLEGNPEYYVDTTIGTYYLSLNTEEEPFNNMNVRKALSLAIDRDYVANTIMQGTYSPAYNFLGPGWMDAEGTQFIDNANGGETYISKDYEANLEEAKRLLIEAGYPNGDGLPTIIYSTNDQMYNKTFAEYLKQTWGELGIGVTVEIVGWDSLTQMRRAGNYMVARNGWSGDYSDPSNMLELLYSTNGNNVGKYNNPEFDAAIELSRTTTDEMARFEALHIAEDILMDSAACIPVAYYNDFWLQSEKVTGIRHSAYGYWYFMYADIAE